MIYDKLSITTDWKPCPICKKGKVVPYLQLKKDPLFETWKVKCNVCGIEYAERFIK